VCVNMEHGWLVSGAQLIDPTLVLSLVPDRAVFFYPGVIPSWSETDGLENELFPHVRFSGFGEDGMGHPGYRSAYEAAWQRLRAAVAGVFFNSVRRSVCKADTRTCREVAGSEKGILPF
jgi:hypothetical protein